MTRATCHKGMPLHSVECLTHCLSESRPRKAGRRKSDQGLRCRLSGGESGFVIRLDTTHDSLHSRQG